MENTITKKVKQLSRTQQGVSLTKEDREILEVQEGSVVEVRKPHSEFIKEVKKANSLPARTHNALNEESQSKSDIAAIKRRDANYTEGVKE